MKTMMGLWIGMGMGGSMARELGMRQLMGNCHKQLRVFRRKNLLLTKPHDTQTGNGADAGWGGGCVHIVRVLAGVLGMMLAGLAWLPQRKCHHLSNNEN